MCLRYINMQASLYLIKSLAKRFLGGGSFALYTEWIDRQIQISQCEKIYNQTK